MTVVYSVHENKLSIDCYLYIFSMDFCQKLLIQ